MSFPSTNDPFAHLLWSRSSCLLGLTLLLWSGCDFLKVDQLFETLQPNPIQLVQDLPADPALGRDPNTGVPIVTNRFTFFSLRENRIVLSTSDEDRSDSASTKWDMAFHSATILLNGGNAWGGRGGGQVLDRPFGSVLVAPDTGYNATVIGLQTAQTAWGQYDTATMLVSPIEGRVLIVRTADGRYAKVRIISYYKGAPEFPDAFTDSGRYYTFEYVFQPNGTRFLKGSAR